MIHLVLPPLTQLNTPYPSTAYLARALRTEGVACAQRDLGIELVLRLFSRPGLERVFEQLEQLEELPDPAWRALALREHHLSAIEPVIGFLQGRDRGLAPRILDTDLLPGGPRLDQADLTDFGRMGSDDAARHLASLYLFDLADLVTACLDPGFGLARYQHHLAVGSASFSALSDRLARTTLVDALLDELTDTLEGDLVGLSVPFPGNLYGALRVGRRLRQRGVEVLMGGGYVNTELREVDEPRLFECVDALMFDDGEGPLLAWLEHRAGGPDQRHRTLTREGWHRSGSRSTPTVFAADYGGLELGHYLQLVDTLNPAHRLWADGRWNKVTLAHGCYWKRCSFCDTSLDYIARYEPARISALVDEMEQVVRATGQRGFHLVDEAAPPAALKALALELLNRGLQLSWWGNIRFERAFTPDLCRLLAAAGMVAVTGGLEVASDRLLERMDKGVTVAQVARAARAFQDAGVMVHAYLMYGFPTQTDQETLDSAETVRQLFAEGALSSAFWHRFVLTRHAPIARDPAAFGVGVIPAGHRFASNDLEHADPSGGDHDAFDALLPAWLEDWMRGRGLARVVPGSRVDPGRIEAALAQPVAERGRQVVWLGGEPMFSEQGLLLFVGTQQVCLEGSEDQLDWLHAVLCAAQPGAGVELGDLPDFPGSAQERARLWEQARAVALVLV
jgi:hypothetical protein